MNDDTKKLIKLWGIRTLLLAATGVTVLWGYSCYAEQQKKTTARLAAVEQHSAILSTRVDGLETKLTTQVHVLEERVGTQVKVLTDEYAKLSMHQQQQQQKWQDEQQALCKEVMDLGNDMTRISSVTNTRFAELEKRLVETGQSMTTVSKTFEQKLTRITQDLTAINIILKELQETEEESKEKGIASITYQVGDEITYLGLSVNDATPAILETIEGVVQHYSVGMQSRRKATREENPQGPVFRLDVSFLGNINGSYRRNSVYIKHQNQTAYVVMKLQGNDEYPALQDVLKKTNYTLLDTARKSLLKLQQDIAQRNAPPRLDQ